jgi:hypothetical protein
MNFKLTKHPNTFEFLYNICNTPSDHFHLAMAGRDCEP